MEFLAVVVHWILKCATKASQVCENSQDETRRRKRQSRQGPISETSGKLDLYLAHTRPDLSCAVSVVSQLM